MLTLILFLYSAKPNEKGKSAARCKSASYKKQVLTLSIVVLLKLFIHHVRIQHAFSDGNHAED